MSLSKPKQKIINDPVHGFINIPANLAYELIAHPYMQRLRNIKQAGLTYLVYPGACHNRFQHALGAMHLMTQAIEALQSKGHEITDEEKEAAQCAILLHDIGHGPFSHTLEHSIVENIDHEELSLLLMDELNRQLNSRLNMALQIFNGTYSKQFLHQLVSSQLDVDRLDYLSRDSFFSGVAEGMIGLERIIKMLNISNGELVVEAKAIYSIEKFLISRHLMYWQVYLHKTVVSAEQLLIKILQRAKELVRNGADIFASPSLNFFLHNAVSIEDFRKTDDSSGNPLEQFAQLTDSDVDCAISVWAKHPDKVLSELCQCLLSRKLFRVEMSNEPFNEERIDKEKRKAQQHLQLSKNDVSYFVTHTDVSNKAYAKSDNPIKILFNNGDLKDVTEVSDILGSVAFSKVTRKYILCYPK
ncbi:MAG: HD domain-containing protein [Prevotellaceae bacterium]|jgi:HD superfamily phosphohydrolase|nr:HD domain-containing protein [Prevotellaceae bacterium]